MQAYSKGRPSNSVPFAMTDPAVGDIASSGLGVGSTPAAWPCTAPLEPSLTDPKRLAMHSWNVTEQP